MTITNLYKRKQGQDSRNNRQKKLLRKQKKWRKIIHFKLLPIFVIIQKLIFKMDRLNSFQNNFRKSFLKKWNKKQSKGTIIDLKQYQRQRGFYFGQYFGLNIQDFRNDILVMSPKEFYQFMVLLNSWKNCMPYSIVTQVFKARIISLQNTYIQYKRQLYHEYMLENPQNQKFQSYKLYLKYQYLYPQQKKQQSQQQKYDQKQSRKQKHDQKQQKHDLLSFVMQFFRRGNSNKVSKKQSVKEADLTIKFLQQNK